MSSEYYSILGIPTKSSLVVIHKAYKLAALRLHPDKNRSDPKANDRFLALAEAYAILSDPSAKAAYDEKISLEEARLARIAEMDQRRRGLRESLIAREKEAASLHLKKEVPGEAERMAAFKFQQELDRIKKKQFRSFSTAGFPDKNEADFDGITPSVSTPSKQPKSFIEKCKSLPLEEYELATFQRFKYNAE